MPCVLKWARNTTNRELHNEMFWVCDAKREDGAARKCGFILCATEEDAEAARRKSVAYYNEVKAKQEADAEAKKRAKYNYNNANLDLEVGSGCFMYRSPAEAATERKIARKEENLRQKMRC